MGPVENTKFDNEGNIRVMNRAARRHRERSDPIYTKATHKFKKMRKKNAPSKQQRQRAIAIARKARKESYTQSTQE